MADPAWLFRHSDEVIFVRDADRLRPYGITELLSGKLQLATIVTGQANQAELSSYKIVLDVEAHFPALSSEPTFCPENILLLFDGIPMSQVGKHRVVSTCFEGYDIQLEFSCDSCLALWCGFGDEKEPPNKIVIDLSRYVEYMGEFVHVEPVEAIDNRNRPDSVRLQD